MNDTLKAAGRIGAELGAAKAENEKLRGLVRRYVDLFADVRLAGQAKLLDAEARAALSEQAEPTDTFTAVDMATAAAQGFRDGQAAVEQAQAPDWLSSYEAMGDRILAAGWRPETDAQWDGLRRMHAEYAAPIAQTAPQPEQSVPEGYVLLPKQCPSWLEDAYDDQCEKDRWHGDGLYLPAYDAMVAALSTQGSTHD